jgi:hypothetical protein
VTERRAFYAKNLTCVGAAERCDLLISSDFTPVEEQNQKIAACGGSYRRNSDYLCVLQRDLL